MVVVGDAGRRLRVVLDVAQTVGEEAVEPRRGRRGAARRLGQRQPLLLGIEVQLGAQVGVAQQRALERLKRAVQSLRDLDRRLVPVALDEVRADRHRQRVLPEDQLPLGLSRSEQLAALGGHLLVVEEPVVRRDGLRLKPATLALADPNGHQTVPGWSFPSRSATWRHQRCSPRHGGVRSPRA
jgi:hypothetical protein